MKFKLTILKVVMIAYLLFFFVYTAINYSTLVSGEGWGMVAIIILIVFGFVGIGVDYVLGLVIKNKVLLNIIGAILAIIFFLWLWPKL